LPARFSRGGNRASQTPRRREREAIDAEFALMAADVDYQAEAAGIMRDFDA
jgi:hypothetical protein